MLRTNESRWTVECANGCLHDHPRLRVLSENPPRCSKVPPLTCGLLLMAEVLGCLGVKIFFVLTDILIKPVSICMQQI